MCNLDAFFLRNLASVNRRGALSEIRMTPSQLRIGQINAKLRRQKLKKTPPKTVFPPFTRRANARICCYKSQMTAVQSFRSIQAAAAHGEART